MVLVIIVKKIRWKKEYFLYVVMFIGLILTHFALLTKNILTADVLLNNSFYNGYSWEISLGRFGLFFVGILKSYLSVPSVDVLLSFTLLVIITYFIIRLFEIDDVLKQAFVAILMVVSPIVSATLLFHYCSIAYLCAFLAGVLSIYLYYHLEKCLWKWMIPICLITFSLSMYQAYLSLIVTVFALYQIKEILSQRFDWKKSGIYCLLLLGGMLLYFVGSKLSLIVFHIDMASYSNANTIGFHTILQIPQKLVDSYRLFYEMFFTDLIAKNAYMKNYVFYLILGITWIIVSLPTVKSSKISLKEKVGCVGLLLLLPVFLNSVIFVISDAKLQLLMSASYLILPIFFLSITKKGKLSIFTLVILSLLFRNYFVQDQATYITLEETYHAYDTVISKAIQNHLYDKSHFIVVGDLSSANESIKKLNYGYISDDGIFWDEYHLRKLGFERFCLRNYGLSLQFGSEEQYKKAQEVDTDYVIYELEDAVVINLSNVQ